MPDTPGPAPQDLDVEQPLDHLVALQITVAMVRAAEDVYTNNDAGATGLDELAHDAEHRALRDKAAEVGTTPGVYLQARPEAVADCATYCLYEWPELREVVNERLNADDHGTQLGTRDTLASAAPAWRFTDENDWLRLNLDTLQEEPPTTDLGTGLGAGF